MATVAYTQHVQMLQVLQTLCNAVLQPAHASASSECLAAMIDACSGMVKKPKDVSHAAGRGAAATGNATGHGANMQGQPQSQSHRPLLSSPLPHLQHVLNMLSDFFYNALANHLPGVQKDQLIATHAQPSGNDGIAASSQSQPSPVADWSAMRAALPGLPVVLQQALAAVLCALGSGILGPALRGEGVYEAMFSQWVGPLLMELLGLEDADVSISLSQQVSMDACDCHPSP